MRLVCFSRLTYVYKYIYIFIFIRNEEENSKQKYKEISMNDGEHICITKYEMKKKEEEVCKEKERIELLFGFIFSNEQHALGFD